MSFIKKNFYLISIVILILFVGMIVLFRQKEPDVPQLKSRVGGISLGGEWINTKQAIDGLIEKLRKNPDDIKLKIQLAQGYIQEARITGDYTYYDEACIKLMNSVLKKEPNNFEALVTLATAYLSQHHFQEGLEVGLRAKKINPHAAFAYGVLTDAYIEMGKYDSAIVMVDSMCAIRPDLTSYSRISYLREIYGDIPGSIEAMNSALNAGIPRMEQTEWVRVYLGRLYEMSGKTDTAEYYYQSANLMRPNYANAIAGLGRIERQRKNYTLAITYFQQAGSLVTDYSFGDELIDLYRLNNQPKKSDSMAKEVVKLLNVHANTDDRNPDAGHYADKELAYVYLKTGENDLALKHAEAEYKRRPDNIDVNEMMAWTWYKRGEWNKCLPFIERAMRTGSKNPGLLCRAGLIYYKNNQHEKGLALLQEAIAINPYLNEDLMQEAEAYVSKTDSQVADVSSGL
jgi:tetratricopeptide (TPR) repeat protein